MTKAIRWTKEMYDEHKARRVAQAQAAADRIVARADRSDPRDHQWTDAELAAMKARNVPPLQFNRIGPLPAPTAEPVKRSKYGNSKIVDGGETFDSKREHRRWLVLVDMQRRGEISDLQRQIPFELIPAQRCDNGKLERACSYVADFGYVQDGQPVVEDSKGMKTKDYVIKRKLLLFVHGITIKET